MQESHIIMPTAMCITLWFYLIPLLPVKCLLAVSNKEVHGYVDPLFAVVCPAPWKNCTVKFSTLASLLISSTPIGMVVTAARHNSDEIVHLPPLKCTLLTPHKLSATCSEVVFPLISKTIAIII